MKAVLRAEVPIRGLDGSVTAWLCIAVLPRHAKTGGQSLWISDEADLASGEGAAVEIVEGQEYLYSWQTTEAIENELVAEPEEIFQPDSDTGLSGRLRPGLATGLVDVSLRAGSEVVGKLDLEVRSKKLNYKSEYRWMLRDIADGMTELVMNRFSASGAKFETDEQRDAVTLYQRFSFLRSLLDGEEFQLAIQEVLRRPYTTWEVTEHSVRPGAGLRGGASVVRQVCRSGPRSPWQSGVVSSLPSRMERQRTEATVDNTPNRFVKYALEHWRQVLGALHQSLECVGDTPGSIRGRREVSVLLTKLDDLLHRDLFVGLGPMSRFPGDDQVLHKKEGYRDIFKAYIEFELAARLSWKPKVDSYGAGLRDVATLYEYWAFIQLAKTIAEFAGKSFDMSPLIEVRPDGLNVGLQAGIETALSGEVVRHGRRMRVELCFNRTFSPVQAGGSWTRAMRPDYSLLITPAEEWPQASDAVVLHFDAKYRVEHFNQLFGSSDELADEGAGISSVERPGDKSGGVVRADLLKMHAYRDAIRRTSGAYVLYPGGETQPSQFSEYHELLPGLGAFALRPGISGEARGVAALQAFLSDVLDHAATRLTQHERGRYWLAEVYGSAAGQRAVYGVAEPVADSSVLLGYVKSREHWSWIEAVKSYNVRAQGRSGGVSPDAALLRSQLLLLYCPETEQLALARIVSAADKMTQGAMVATGYPRPRGDYWCVQLSWINRPDWLAGLSAQSLDRHVQKLGQLRGEPTPLTWGTVREIAGK